MPQSIDQKLDVLGRFATVADVRKVWGTKLYIDRQGDFELQEAGFKTFWKRSSEDSLSRPEVHNRVYRVFEEAVRNVTRAGIVWAGNHQPGQLERIRYAFKGYSTLVRKGYSDSRVMRTHLQHLGCLVQDGIVPIPHEVRFAQTDHIPSTSGGMCWGFVLDWLRRCFKAKYAYAYNQQVFRDKIASKLGAVAGLQKDQGQIKERAYFSNNPNLVRSDPLVAPNQRDYERRFQNIEYHRFGATFDIPRDSTTCFNINPPGSPLHPPQLCLHILQYIEVSLMKHILAKGTECGFLIELVFASFMQGAACGGHAIGMYAEGNNTIHCFDPNYGSIRTHYSLNTPEAAFWLAHLITAYSLQYRVVQINVRSVTSG